MRSAPPRLVPLGLAACLVSFLIALGPESGEGPSAPSPASSGSRELERGPELIREYFRRWHDPAPADLDPATLSRLRAEIRALGESEARGGEAPWTCFGPFGLATSPGGTYSGRILDLDAGVGGLRAVAAASGGVWTRDAGGWQPRTDALPSQWIGSLDVHPSDPNVMLAGTGEPFIRAGAGLFKTTDGGATWVNRPMSPPPATCFRVRWAANGTTVHGAFDLGYYRSTNGGDTWTRFLDLGAWPSDLALHPTDPSVLYLTIWGQGVFRSVNGGTIWNELPSPDLPQTDLGRGAITICASDPDRIYVTWANAASSLRGVYRTTDGGATWTDVSPHEFLWGQGWYNNTIAVSPTDPDLVLAGGGELLRTTDGGATWTGANDPALHADFHACEWSADGTQVWVGHDGGFSHSTDAGLTWSAAENTLPITQFVLVGASPSAEPFVLGGGSQDNGISLTTDGGASWRFGHGGDGGGFSVHPTDPNVIYSTAGLYGGIWTFRRLRSTDGGANWNHVDGGIGVGSQWWIRVRNDLEDPPTWYSYGDGYVYRTTTGFWFGMNNTATAFPHFVSELTASRAGGNGGTVYACLDSAIDGERLRVWNGSAFEERSAGLPSGFAVRKVPSHPRDPDVAFALMNGIGNPGQKIFRTTDRGQQWTNVTGNLPDVPLADLVAHPTDDQRLYLGTEMGMFATTDGGGTWARWHDGLPEAVVVTELTYVDRLAETGEFHLVAGTYGRGIWARPVAPTATATPLPAAADPSLRLEAAGPNPFRDGTTLAFSLPRDSGVTLRLFDVSGRKVLDVLEERRPAGPHRVQIDGRALPAGVYFARLETELGVSSLPVTRLR